VTDLIRAVQKQSIDSSLVYLFEITLSGGTVLYFHPDYDTDNLNSNEEGYIYFRDRTDPTIIRNYAPFPMDMTGIDLQADGAINRPTLTVANVTSTFSDALGGLQNDDLVGQTVVKRTTLKKYLYGEPGDASPSVEFPIQKYVIDRIESENPVSVTFELAPPFDLSGIKLPSRMVLGKYCSWQYQGNDINSCGGCKWNKDSHVTLPNTGELGDFDAYFTDKDVPIVNANLFSSNTSINPAFNPNSYSYSVGDTIYNSDSGGSIWVCKTAHTSQTWSNSYYQANWVLVAFLVWTAGKAYYVDDYIKNGNNYYRCNNQHTAHASDFTNDINNWDVIYTYTVWNSSDNYSTGDYVERTDSTQTTVWKALLDNNDEVPAEGLYWTRGDKCGKRLSSCKSRFQFKPRTPFTTTYAAPRVTKDTTVSLPFGAFPGAGKFR